MLGTPNWAEVGALALAIAGASAGLYRYVTERRAKARAASPLLEWNGRTLMIRNRADVPIIVTRVETDGVIFKDTGDYVDGLFQPSDVEIGSSIEPGVAISAGGTTRLDLLIRSSDSAKVTLLSKRSAVTSKRLTITIRRSE